MTKKKRLSELPEIPAKRYFRINEASELCGVRDYVLRFWEKEFPQLRPRKRGAHRAYVRKDILIARRIRELVYGEGYKLSAAREILAKEIEAAKQGTAAADTPKFSALPTDTFSGLPSEGSVSTPTAAPAVDTQELESIIENMEKIVDFLRN